MNNSPLASLKTLYAAFSFLKSENENSTSLQWTERRKRLDQISSTFLNTQFVAIARVSDVRQGLVSAELELSERRFYGNATSPQTYNFVHFHLALSFLEAFQEQALALRVGDHVKVRGTLLKLSVESKMNSGQRTRDYPVFFNYYPSMQIEGALTSLEVTEKPNYESLKTDLDRKERTPHEEAQAQAELLDLRQRRKALLRVKLFFACAAGVLVGGIAGFIVAMILGLPLILICAAMGNEGAANTIMTGIVVIGAVIGGVVGLFLVEATS